jgi:hypothetical protein
MQPDFKKQFELGRLTELELGNIEYVLMSPAYSETFKPYLETVRNNLNALWLDRTKMRKDQMSDDFLAGGISMIDGLLKFFAIVVHESSMERIHASQAARSPDQEYDIRQRLGQMRPVVGLDQSALPQPYDPAEDY